MRIDKQRVEQREKGETEAVGKGLGSVPHKGQGFRPGPVLQSWLLSSNLHLGCPRGVLGTSLSLSFLAVLPLAFTAAPGVGTLGEESVCLCEDLD